ncbi:hypothetical protein [Amycolatopsis sp. CA-230715]|uniref:hypothetical protein n=1 Tax=Amycolatopsis sp. CA-230715 TaxID=2745196 RepID=UPI001C01D421|nr:hypothetical protein [Amycolatopsis sp. CA-230715]
MRTSKDAIDALVSRGFRAIPLAGSPSQPESVLFTLGWDEPYMDEVLVRDEQDATACRHRLENGIDFSDRKHVVWFKDGSVLEVVDEILHRLPHPSNPNAPRLVIPTPGNLWIPPSVRIEVRS